ncbi:hypothetical protein, partial [Salinivirga cyanobacteriivorans]
AGGNAFVIGVLVVLTTSLVGLYSQVHFPDVISVKMAPPFPLKYYILQGLMNWVVLSTVFYLLSVIFSKSRVRFIDVLGTQALARFPYLLAALTGFSDAMNRFGDYILYQVMDKGEPVVLGSETILTAIMLIVFIILMTIWLVVLMYNAFSVSANLKGPKSIFIFIGGLITAILISAFLNTQLIELI